MGTLVLMFRETNKLEMNITLLLFTVYCFCREMRSPGGSCFPLCNLLKNSVTSGVILKVNMSLFGCKFFLYVLIDLKSVETFIHKVFI